jgi:DNA processing protein
MNSEVVLAVLALPGIGPVKARIILARLSTSQIETSNLAAAAGVSIDVANRAIGFAQAEVRKADSLGVHLHVPAPSQEPWAGLKSPPILLYARGKIDALNQASAALVGSRKTTPKVEDFMRDAAEALVEKGATITSGLAFGCDAAAHEGCLEAGGTTLAALPGDVSEPRPKTHNSLAESIVASGGLLFSEYGIGSGEPRRHQYVARNRLQAALGEILIVGETTIDGGTMTTIKHAHELGRPIGIFDGGENSHSHESVNHLVKQFGAKTLRTTDDVVALWENKNTPASHARTTLDGWA